MNEVYYCYILIRFFFYQVKGQIPSNVVETPSTLLLKEAMSLVSMDYLSMYLSPAVLATISGCYPPV